MKKIAFADCFSQVAEGLFGADEGEMISEQFEQYSSIIVNSLDLVKPSPRCDVFKILKVLQYFDHHIMFSNISLFVTKFPYRKNLEEYPVALEDFWHLRNAFYAGNGKATTIIKIKNGLEKARYKFIMDVSILDHLPLHDPNNKATLYNHTVRSNPHKRKMEKIYNDFRTKWGQDYQKVSQADFMDFVYAHIDRNVADHDLKALWRNFENETDQLLAEINVKYDTDSTEE